jgi:nitroreductase
MLLDEITHTMATCRQFRDDPVDDETLATVLDAGRWAPQGGNRQPVHFVVVRDADKRARLGEWYLRPWKAYMAERMGTTSTDEGQRHKRSSLAEADHFAEHFGRSPVIVVVCAELAGIHPTDDKLDRLSVVGGASIYPAVQNVLLKAREVGLGAALTTLLCEAEPEVRELLAIPEGFITAAHIPMGWPLLPFPKQLRRRPLGRMTHLDTFGTPFAQEAPR